MSEDRATYTVEVAGLTRHLPLFEIAPGVTIAIVNILGDSELIQASSRALAERLRDIKADLLISVEAKAIPLVYQLAIDLGLPWIVLRKTHKPYMGDAFVAETMSITTGKPQTLYMDEKDRHLIKGKRVILVDDVISTGSTLQSMQLLVDRAEAIVAAQTAIFTEGDRAKWQDIVALGHLPVFLADDK